MSTAASVSLQAQFSSNFTVTVRGLGRGRRSPLRISEGVVRSVERGGAGELDQELRGQNKIWGRVSSPCAPNLVGPGSVGVEMCGALI